MVRRGRARMQKQGGMLASLGPASLGSLGEIDAPPPDRRRKENVHSNELESAPSPPRKEKGVASSQPPPKVATSSQQQKTSKPQLKSQQARTSPKALQNKPIESPPQHRSPLITSPSAPLTSVKIKTFNSEHQPIRRELFQSPLSAVSSRSSNGDEGDNDSCASSEEESSLIKTRMSNDSRSIQSDDSEEDESPADADGSEDESLNSQSSNESTDRDTSNEQSVDSRNSYEESVPREYEESEDEEFSMSAECESEDDLQFDDESSVGSTGRRRNGRKKVKDERKKSKSKTNDEGKKATRQNEEISDTSDSESSAVLSVEAERASLSKKFERTVETENNHCDGDEDTDLDHEGGSSYEFAVDEETNNTDKLLQQTSSNENSDNLAPYISTLQHTQIKPSKRTTKALTKAASATEPTHSQIIEVVDELFHMVEDKDSFTYGDFVHSFAEHFGLSKVNKEIRQRIKTRLKELIRASEEGVHVAATKSVGVERGKERSMTRVGANADKRFDGNHPERAATNKSTCVVSKEEREQQFDSIDKRRTQHTTSCRITDPFVEHFGPNIIAMVDRLFNEAESDTVFFSDIVNAVASNFGVPKVSKDTKKFIKARFVELIEAKERSVDPDCEDGESASADQPFTKLDSVHETGDQLSTSYSIDGTESVALNVFEESAELELSFDGAGSSFLVQCADSESDAEPPKEECIPNDDNETTYAPEEGGELQLSVDPIETSSIGNIDDKESRAPTPSIEKDTTGPSSLIASIDSHGQSLAGEYLKCNESFMSCETTLFKNLSPECLKSKNDESMDRLMGSLSMSDSLNSTSDIRRVEKGKWTLGNEIGSGSFGVVHVGMNAVDGSLMAIKVLSIPSKNKRAIVEELQREIDLMRSLNHPNIVRYLGAEVDTSNNILNIFQEWVPGGSVSSMLKKFGPFSITVVKLYATQILKGLAYLHSHHIIHRDIKGGNILVSNDGCVKLADFGASKKVEAFGIDPDKVMEDLTVRGTPYFMAPEVFQEKYNSKADIWSVGGVIFQMATGSPPWKELGHKNPISLFFHLQKTDDPPKLPSSIANQLLEDIISKCFQRDPSRRPNAPTLLDDNFFKSEIDVKNPLSGVSDNLPLSPPAIMSPSTDYVRAQNADGTSMEDSLCYSLTLTGPIHFDEQLKSDVDTFDWPDWAKQSYRLSKLNESDKLKQNPFARRDSSTAVSANSCLR